MSIRIPIFSKKSLSKNQKDFLKVREISSKKKVEEWIHFFQGIVQFDIYNDRLRFYLEIGIIANLAISLVFLLYQFYWWGTGALCFVLLLSRRFFKLNRLDIPSHLRNIIIPLLLVLKEEVHDENKLLLKVDIRGINKDKETEIIMPVGISEEENPKIHATHYYTDVWFDANTKFRDETAVSLKITNFIEEKEMSYLSTSGKIKEKMKVRVKTFIESQLVFSSEKYKLINHWKSKLPEIPSKVKVDSSETHHIIKSKLEFKFQDDEVDIQPKDCFDTISSGYTLVQQNKDV
ncbi:MAG: hypothetical protein ACI86H_001878 [bacterium]|jgi:hypothetical protein